MKTLTLKSIMLVSSIAMMSLVAHPVSAKSKSTLFDKLGGHDGMEKIVYGMLERTHTDPRTSAIMENSNIDRNTKFITEYFCAVTDGPCEYSGQDMHKVHYGLGIETKHFNALVENLQESMTEQNIPFRVQGKLLAKLAPKHRDVVIRARDGK